MLRNPGIALSAAIAAVLLGGQFVPEIPTRPEWIAALLGVATLMSLSGMRRGWHRQGSNHGSALWLLAVNVLAGSLPLVAAAAFFGFTSPAGIGLMAVAAMPVAAGLPAYASSVGLRMERLILFCIYSYAIAVPLTPLVLVSVVDAGGSGRRLGLTLVLSLLLPTVAALAFGGPLTRIPHAVRRSISITCLLTAMLGISVSVDLASAVASDTRTVVIAAVAVALLRSPACGVIAAGLTRLVGRARDAGERREVVLAGAYKNCAVAASVALAAGVPAAAMVPLLGIFSETFVLSWAAIAGGPSRKESVAL